MTEITPRSAWVGPLFTCLIVTSTSACRYSVRDVGFVDLREPAYRLVLVVRDDTPPAWANACEQASYAVLLDSNVEFGITNLDRQKDHDAVRYVESLRLTSYPAMVLVSPQGRAMKLVAPPSPTPDERFAAAWLEGAVVSPSRAELIRTTVEAYCAILLIEGDVGSENEEAERAISGTIEEIHKAMGNLPKPIANPPRMVRVSAKHRTRENVLLWSLGVDPSKTERPSVAVVYGRGRRIGPLFEGPGITQTSLIARVSLGGESCECGLDRQQMLGVMIPLRWEDSVQAEATRKLGFDPENPMVRTEVAQILAMGRGRPVGQEDGDGFDLMGYSEQVVRLRSDSDDRGAEADPVAKEDSETATSAASQPEASESKPVIVASEAAGRTKTASIVGMEDRQADRSLGTAWLVGGALAMLILVGGAYILLRARGRAA